MKRSNRFFCLAVFLLCFFNTALFCQPEEDKPNIGIKLGGVGSYFGKEDLLSTIYPNFGSNPGCMHSEDFRLGSTLSVLFFYRRNRDAWAIQAEGSYFFNFKGEPSKDYDLQYSTSLNSYKSDLFYQFNPEYLNFTLISKLYLSTENMINDRNITSGIHLQLGARIGIITADDRIDLGSTIHDHTYVLNLRSDYRNTLRGTSNFGIIGGIGWDALFGTGLTVEARYFRGLKDTLEVIKPNLGVNETMVKNHSFEFNVGYIWPLNER